MMISLFPRAPYDYSLNATNLIRTDNCVTFSYRKETHTLTLYIRLKIFHSIQ